MSNVEIISEGISTPKWQSEEPTESAYYFTRYSRLDENGEKMLILDIEHTPSPYRLNKKWPAPAPDLEYWPVPIELPKEEDESKWQREEPESPGCYFFRTKLYWAADQRYKGKGIGMAKFGVGKTGRCLVVSEGVEDDIEWFPVPFQEPPQ